MMKHALATTMFAALLLSAGAAMAQTYPQQTYAPRNYAHQTYAPETYAPQTYAPMNTEPTSLYNGASLYNDAAAQRTEWIGDTYTSALNDLYSHGFHGVHRLWMHDGMVGATAVTPHGNLRNVNVNSGSGLISLG